ncbi:hypothetical protein R2Q81_07060 [Microbacterium aquimaris]|uniref:hypothetical protein n=1 Tax=Microbacterium aquimaris TaxID=459816 RepID=UPI002AD26A4C|nr:hypothetical protein [Microbacterium aquimaris]MDZ8275708.1 hypothetical protein [Microbacterium aquimaris]
MADRTLTPGWPRMAIDEATIALAKLRELSPADAHGLVSTDVESRRFYATAPTRVDKKRLDDLRASVVRLAERHGFPGKRRERATPTFDQELAVLFATWVPMLPVEAADEEIWAFLTLRVLPDVAVWRWPAKPGDPDRTVVGDANEAAPTSDSRAERLLGRRRGVFRQAWWRAHLLGPDACLKLDEDNFNNLTDRVSLTGYRRVGPLITEEHLARLHRGSYDQRFALRRALILIGREFGRFAVEALPEERVRVLIASAFDQAERDVAEKKAKEAEEKAEKTATKKESREPTITSSEESGLDETPPAADVSLVAPDEEPQQRTVIEEASGAESATAPTDTRTRFLQTVAPYASVLEPMLVPVDYATAMAMLVQAEQHVRALNGDPTAARICDDLSDLIGDWSSLEDIERSIVYAALAYFVEDDDIAADGEPGGLLDDDEVVASAFVALGRERELG